MSRRTFITILLVVLLVVGGYLLYRQIGTNSRNQISGTRVAPGERTRVVQVRRGQLNRMVEATGNLAVNRQQMLTFSTAGTVKAIYVEEGARVHTGELLAELDTTDLEFQVKNAEQTLHIQEAALAALKATPEAEDVEAARAALEQARQNLAKIQEGPSKEELAAAEAALESAREAYQRLLELPDPNEVEQAKLKVEQAKNTLWSAQVNRDQICGQAEHNPALYAQCKSAEAQVNNAEIALKLAELAYEHIQKPPTDDQLAAALAKVRNAESTLAKLKERPTEVEIATAKAQVAQAEANLARLLRGPSEESIAQAEARVEQARIALQQAKHTLEKTRLVAPFDGIVAEIDFEEGDSVGPNGPGLILLDLSRFYVDVQVNEAEIGQVRIGQPVFLTVDAYPDQVINGRVTYISPVGKSIQGVITYRVRVELEPTDLPLLANMTTTARISVGKAEEALLVPLPALHSDARGEYVEVLQEDGRTRRVYVQVGQRSNLMVEVSGDLHEGDKVIVTAPPGSREGQKDGKRPAMFLPFGRRPGGK